MAFVYQNTNITQTGADVNAVTLGQNDQFYLVDQVEVAATNGGSGVFCAGSAVIEIVGSVIGFHGLELGGLISATFITIDRAGRVSGYSDDAIQLNGGVMKLVNHGSISSLENDGVELDNGTTGTIWNYGAITGLGNDGVDAGFSNSRVTLYNFGSITGGNGNGVFGSPSADVVINTGTISGSSSSFAVLLASGADLYDGRGGRALGAINGDSGNDTLYGGLGADRLFGGSDNDTLYFDAEDLRSGVVLGGTGYDTGYNIDETTPLSINLTVQEMEAYFGSAADETVVCGTLGGFGGFIRMGTGNDLVDGSGQGDNIDGGLGIDVLYGRGGTDDLAGGLGGDWVQGGAGADTFRYNALTDSTVNGQDFIADFSTADGDKINLTNALAGLAPATFNTGFGTGTSVFVFAGGGGTSLVQVYTGATLQMQLVVSQASLAASDFVF